MLGGGFAEPVQNVSHTGDAFSITADINDMGYIITDGDKSSAFWVVNYANHPWTVRAIVPAESDCSRVWINVAGSSAARPYDRGLGRRALLPRGLRIGSES